MIDLPMPVAARKTHGHARCARFREDGTCEVPWATSAMRQPCFRMVVGALLHQPYEDLMTLK